MRAAALPYALQLNTGMMTIAANKESDSQSCNNVCDYIASERQSRMGEI